MRQLKTIGLALLAAMAMAALMAPAASAAFGLAEADVQYLEEDGSPATLAGSHPFAMATTITLNTTTEGGTESPDGALKDLTVDLPEGFAGIPAATERCTGEDFATLDIDHEPQPLPECSDDAAVGYVSVGAAFNPFPIGGVEYGASVLYNLEPAPGTVAKFGFVYLRVPVTVEVKLSQQAPYHVEAVLRNAPQPLLFYGSTLTIWGTPADDAHDPYRGHCFGGIEPDGDLVSQGNCPVSEDAPLLPLVTLPRACPGPLPTLFAAASWQAPSTIVEKESESAPAFEDCEALGLSSTIEATPTSSAPHTPTGLDFSVDVEDEGITDPAKRAGSDIKRLVATLPEGLTLTPSAADGLASCSLAQYEAEALHSDPGDNCPDASKVGSVSIDSPLIEEDLQGALYVATPEDPSTPGKENPFGSFLATYMVLRSTELGVIVKQAGELSTDPASGQITATFNDIPQLPFGHLETHFRSGPRAPLSTPTGCGDYEAQVVEEQWANPGETTTATADFQISGPCTADDPGPFSPSFVASTQSAAAGQSSPLTIHLNRGDPEAELTRLSLTLPKGLTGKPAGVPRCTEADIASAQGKTGRQELANPSCPASSQVGRVVAGAGVGGALTYVEGRIYWAGPVAGAPFSVVVITPAVAGPFDAGNVVLRQPLQIDPTTAQAKIDGANADPVPRILKGIPLRLRDLRLFVDRPGFMLNPTSCAEKQIDAKATGAGPLLPASAETIADLASRYQASNCEALGFKPKLQITLKGSTKRTGHPALRAKLTTRPGDANFDSVSVTLPPSQFIDQAHINNPCTRVQFNANACPPKSVLGTVRATTPLLDNPLEGPVYFRSNGGERDLPDIVADLNGEAHIVLVGFVDSVRRKGTEISRTRTTFASTPDAPVQSLEMSLYGGKRGLLQNSRNLCARPQKASVKMGAQNGRRNDLQLRIKTSCKGKKKGKGKGGRGR